MNIRNNKIDIISEGHLYFLRNISVDNVIFSYHDEELKVLLCFNRFKQWSLTGGFIDRTETLDEAAYRVAKLPTHLENIFMKQFKAFGGSERRNYDYPFVQRSGEMDESKGIVIPKDSWLNDYFVTIGYYSLIEFSKVQLEMNTDREYRWWNVYDLPPLMIDHNKIIESALNNLREDLNSKPIAKELLPNKFTLPELQTLFETVQDKKLDRGNFYKRMKSLGWLIKLYERKNIGPHKSPFLHMFDPDL